MVDALSGAVRWRRRALAGLARASKARLRRRPGAGRPGKAVRSQVRRSRRPDRSRCTASICLRYRSSPPIPRESPTAPSRPCAGSRSFLADNAFDVSENQHYCSIPEGLRRFIATSFKVRRDLKLVLGANLVEVINTVF